MTIKSLKLSVFQNLQIEFCLAMKLKHSSFEIYGIRLNCSVNQEKTKQKQAWYTTKENPRRKRPVCL